MRRLTLAVIAALLVAGCGGARHESFTGSVHPSGWGKPPPPTALQHAILPNAATVTMYDSVTLSTVPSFPFAQAGYTAGHWVTFGPMRQRWPHAHTVSIAIAVRYHADCLDVEQGDATPSEVVAWIRVEIRLGWPRPCVYSDWWHFTHLIDPLLEAAGITHAHIWKWDADYTHQAHIDPGFDATQYEDKCFGRNLDCSLVLRGFLAIAHPPLVELQPRPKPRPVNPRLERLYGYRHYLRRQLLAGHCRMKRSPTKCRRELRTGARVNREIHKLGGR